MNPVLNYLNFAINTVMLEDLKDQLINDKLDYLIKIKSLFTRGYDVVGIMIADLDSGTMPEEVIIDATVVCEMIEGGNNA